MHAVPSTSPIRSIVPLIVKRPPQWSAVPRTVFWALVVFLAAQCGSAYAVPNNYVTASYDPVQQLITLTGDAGNNTVTVAWKSNVVTVTGIGLTRIGTALSSSTSVSFHTGSSVGITANLNGGNDSILINSLRSSNVSLNLGDGNDFARLTYCNITADPGVTALSIIGGIGNDTFSRSATRISKATYTTVEVFFPPQ